MKNVVITEVSRTAVGAYLKSLKTVPPEVLAATVVKDIVGKSNLDITKIGSVILGNVLSPQPNIARVSALLAGLCDETPAYTVNRLCASSLQAVINAYQTIATNETSIVIAGGTESLSRAPYRMPDSIRSEGAKSGNIEVMDSFQFASYNAQPQSIYPELNMGITAENVAKKYSITREEQDVYALTSQQKYADAFTAGYFKDEIVPVATGDRGKEFIFDIDEHARLEITLEKLSQLPPVFLPNGSVTSGNSCGLNDGASAILLMDENVARKEGNTPLARIISYAVVGVNPAYMGLGVVPAMKKALTLANLALDDIDLIEINEAFAAQMIGCLIELGIYKDEKTMEKINVSGGAIAHGHALANSGTRMITTLLNNLIRHNKKYGLISMCVGGGQGVAIIIENINA